MNDDHSPLEHALGDGEDFESLFTLSDNDADKLLRDWNGPTRLTQIGRITLEAECRLLQADGSAHLLPPLGWQHEW